MRFVISICLLIYAIQPQLKSQQSSFNTYHPFSGTVVISAEVGGTYPVTDLASPELDILGRGLVEYYFPSKFIHAIGIRVLGGGGYLSSTGEVNNREFNHRTGFFFIGGGLTYALKIGNGVPYVSATMSYLLYDPRDGEGYLLPYNREKQFDQSALMQNVELGIRFPFAEVLSLNLGISMNFTWIDNLDGVDRGLDNDLFASAFVGISLYVGGEKDSDGDGVEDDKDICPATPLGLNVNEFGCSIDSDSDGVPDDLDKCKNTPKNILIDEDGCPIDSDNDGVPDYLDKCPNSSQNVLVDENGCIEKQNAIGADSTTNQDKNHLEKNESLIVKGYDLSNEKLLEGLFYTDGELYCFLLGSFRDKNNAEKELKDLILDGHNAFLIEASPFNNNLVRYRVRIGYFNSLEEAKTYKGKYFK